MQKLLRLGATLSRTAVSVKTSNFAPLNRFPQFRHYSHGTFVFDIESADDFQEKVIQSELPVIVDFHAEWCGPCQALGPRLEEKVNGRNGSVLLAKINVDHAGELAMDYGISAVPTVFGFKNGEKLSGFSGVLDDEQLDEFIDDVIAA